MAGAYAAGRSRTCASNGCAQVKSSEYNGLKSTLGQVTRKSQGSLAVRDVNTVVKPQAVIDTEHLISLFVVVSKFALKEWEETYERMCQYVVSWGDEGRENRGLLGGGMGRGGGEAGGPAGRHAATSLQLHVVRTAARCSVAECRSASNQ